MRRFFSTFTLAFLLLAGGLSGSRGEAAAQERFPPPDLGPTYSEPVTELGGPDAGILEYVDVLALLAALSCASYLALVKRSRRWIFVLMLASLAYFGFWRQGCVCPIGATQNATLALFDSAYAIPLSVLAFLLLPLVFALVFGRTFCAAVCPLGAAQDVVLVKPVKVPQWLEHALGLLAYVYLGTAVLFAATGAAFVICRYDPFVGFFRVSGSVGMFVLGACFLAAGVFVGRPYCRFLCPYGALLRVFSSVSWRHVRINPAGTTTVSGRRTPDECMECRLCEDACPFGAILKPNQEQTSPDRAGGVRRLAVLMLLLPVIVALGGWLGASLEAPMSRVHHTVRLAEMVRLDMSGRPSRRTGDRFYSTEEIGAARRAKPLVQEETGPRESATQRDADGSSDELDAFRGTGRAPEDLYAEAAGLRSKFRTGGWLFGGWVGLVVGLKMISLSVRRTRTGYEPDRAKCVSCGRCFGRCPAEHARLEGTDGQALQGASGSGPSGVHSGETDVAG